MTSFANRSEAGRALAAKLREYAGRADVIVLGLPRGGVPVAAEVARELGAPLDVFVVRKLGLPDAPELAIGAIASGGVRVLNREIVEAFEIDEVMLENIALEEEREIERREQIYRADRAPLSFRGRTVILVDDGLATGATMRAACIATRRFGARKIVVAVPVASAEACGALEDVADEVTCGWTPEPFFAVGQWYLDFTQTTDEEVRALLEASARRDRTWNEHTVHLASPSGTLEGLLAVPKNARGVVLFAHGSGSSRFSPRNGFVARTLRERGLATLLIDLLTKDEEDLDLRTSRLRFDIPFLAHRLLRATRWLAEDVETRELSIGYFGASTGAAAALVAAAERPDAIDAIVSRGGRPDLAGGALAAVRAPTLLIVGGDDYGVIEENAEAFDELRAQKEFAIVPGASHLFEEPGALDEVARLAGEWFVRHLGKRAESPRRSDEQPSLNR